VNGAAKPGGAVGSGLDERWELGVDLILVRRAHTVRSALDDLQPGIREELGREHSRVRERHDLIVVAVQDQRRDMEFLWVLGEVSLGEGLDAEMSPGSPAITDDNESVGRSSERGRR
jgi:hypothetical protein